MPQEQTPRILVCDIETSPLESFTWGLFDQNVGLEQIKTEWSILSYAAKWLREPKFIYQDTGGRGKARVRDDKPLMRGLWNLLDEADIVVAQNGQAFDIKKINARLVMHGYGPYSPIRVVDTLLVAKKHFAFTSNKLAWQAKYLTKTPKSEHKEFPGFELWLGCLADNPRAWAEMKKYNQQDVLATEELYLKQLPWIAGHPNMAAYVADGKGVEPVCPKCGSDKLVRRGFQHTQHAKYARYQCGGCHGWSRGKTNLIDKGARKASLVN